MPLSQFDADLFASADPPYRLEVEPTCAYCCDRLTTEVLDDDSTPSGYCSTDCRDLEAEEDRRLDPPSCGASEGDDEDDADLLDLALGAAWSFEPPAPPSAP